MTEASKQWEGRIVEGTYILRQYLGGSDHSAVFLTEDRDAAGQKAAIKLVPADPALADQQLLGWESAAQLSHPNLLRLLDGGRCRIEGNELLYLVMEFAEENLSQILPERALTPDETRDMLGPVLDALEFLHGRGYVHGDVKPANILAMGDRLKLSSDAIWNGGEAHVNRRKASPYDPPEAINGVMTPSGDVWALGTTLVEVLTQHLPEWQPGRHVEPTVPATLPAPFLEIARQALRVDPQGRITIADISARLSARAVMASAAGAGASISAVAAAPPVPLPAAPKPIVSQAVPPRPPVRLKPAPRPPLYHGESRPRSRFIVPLIVGALVFAGIITVPRLLTHRPADASAPPAASGKASSEAVARKAAPVSAAGHPDSAPAKPEQLSAAKKTATAVVPAQEKSAQGNAPPAVEPVKTASNREQPSASAAAAPGAPEKVARTAVPGSGSAKGEVLDQVLPDVSQKARDTIQGKVRVSVKVHVDPSGAVSDAELDSPGPSKFFADLAMEAAKKWVFSPPEIEGKSVASEWRLRFDFRQKETKVTPTQTAP